jgi:hypothetical protein
MEEGGLWTVLPSHPTSLPPLLPSKMDPSKGQKKKEDLPSAEYSAASITALDEAPRVGEQAEKAHVSVVPATTPNPRHDLDSATSSHTDNALSAAVRSLPPSKAADPKTLRKLAEEGGK